MQSGWRGECSNDERLPLELCKKNRKFTTQHHYRVYCARRERGEIVEKSWRILYDDRSQHEVLDSCELPNCDYLHAYGVELDISSMWSVDQKSATSHKEAEREVFAAQL